MGQCAVGGALVRKRENVNRAVSALGCAGLKAGKRLGAACAAGEAGLYHVVESCVWGKVLSEIMALFIGCYNIIVLLEYCYSIVIARSFYSFTAQSVCHWHPFKYKHSLLCLFHCYGIRYFV